MRAWGLVPPVAVPVGVGEVAGAVRAYRRGGCGERFAEGLAEVTGASTARLFSSGRAGLTRLLAELARSSTRSEVVVPGYACYTVPAAVVRAGLKVRVCDVAPETLDFEPEALERAVSERTLAVVAVHALGYPCDIRLVSGVARGQGAVVVEDCAQYLSRGSAEARGDVMLLSFGRGKPLTTLGGGALLSLRPEWEETVRAAATGIEPRTGRVATFAEALAYGALTRPVGYRMIERLPALEIGATHFDITFEIAGLDAARAALGAALLPRLAEWNRLRRQYAEALGAALAGVPRVRTMRVTEGAAPLRVPVRTAPELRAGLVRGLREAGIGAAAMYPAALVDVPELLPYLAEGTAPCPGAREVVETLFSVPCHPGAGDLSARAARAIAEAVSRPRDVTCPAGEAR